MAPFEGNQKTESQKWAGSYHRFKDCFMLGSHRSAARSRQAIYL
jgi:hypothetical protein